MVKERKNESKKTSVGKDCDCSVLELVDGFCTSLFGENCSRMADYNLPHFWIYETTVPFYFLKTQYSFERKRTIVIYMITSVRVYLTRERSNQVKLGIVTTKIFEVFPPDPTSFF
jgi:hypothetical protein